MGWCSCAAWMETDKFSCGQLMYISKKRYAIERLPDQALG